MSEVTEGDTTVKLSKKALNDLSSRARPFESKKACLERIIQQDCSPTEIKESDEESDLESKSEAKE